jgi:hypothetical protein
MSQDRFMVRRAQVARPANTTNYGAGDAIGTATSCILEFDPGPRGANGGRIQAARLTKSDATTHTNDTFRLLLFNRLPAVAPVDNDAPTTSWIKEADQYVGSIDFEVRATGADADTYEGQDFIPSGGLIFGGINKDGKLYGILTALGAYNPASAEVFYVDLFVEQ